MKSIKPLLVAALCAIPAIRGAEPINIRNTSGTELTVEIITTEGEQVTFTRTSDGQEFTIPLSMLDEPSQQKISKWELMEKYQPDSAPFFKLGDEYVIPVDIKGNDITLFDANGQKKEVNSPQALKLRSFTESNKKALGANQKPKLESIQRIQPKDVTKLILKNGLAAIFNGSESIKLWKEYRSPDEPMLQEISYEIFLPKDISVSTLDYFAEFFTMIDDATHLSNEVKEQLTNHQITARLQYPIPVNLSSGKWVKNKAVIRTFKHAVNMAVFNNIENTPFAVRNLEFKPVKPGEKLLTISDLLEGYNFFHSNKGFHLSSEGKHVKIVSDSDIFYSLTLDTGYEAEIEIEYENGEVTGKQRRKQIADEANVRMQERSKGSRTKTVITFDGQNHSHPTVFLKPSKNGMIIHQFDVSIKKKRNAEKINALHL